MGQSTKALQLLFLLFLIDGLAGAAPSVCNRAAQQNCTVGYNFACAKLIALKDSYWGEKQYEVGKFEAGCYPLFSMHKYTAVSHGVCRNNTSNPKAVDCGLLEFGFGDAYTKTTVFAYMCCCYDGDFCGDNHDEFKNQNMQEAICKQDRRLLQKHNYNRCPALPTTTDGSNTLLLVLAIVLPLLLLLLIIIAIIIIVCCLRRKKKPAPEEPPAPEVQQEEPDVAVTTTPVSLFMPPAETSVQERDFGLGNDKTIAPVQVGDQVSTGDNYFQS